MKHQILIKTADGSTRTLDVEAGLSFPVSAGSDIFLIDESQNPSRPEMVKDGNTLILVYESGNEDVTVELHNFYSHSEDPATVTFEARPSVAAERAPLSPVDSDSGDYDWAEKYDMKGSLGNLPMGDDFSLLHYSSVGQGQFHQDLDQFKDRVSSALHSTPYGGSAGGGGGGAPHTDQAPVAADDVESVDEDGRLVIDVRGNDFDPDGDAITVCGIEDASGEMVTPAVGVPITLASGASVVLLANGQLEYLQNGVYDHLGEGESAAESFSYKIDDGNGNISTATVTLTIDGVDDATDTNPDTATTLEDTPISGNVLTNDSDPDTADNPLRVVGNTEPRNGSVTIEADGSYTYTPNPDFNGTDSFTYTTNTGATETVTITVTPVNDAPDAKENYYTVSEDATPAVIGNAIADGVEGDVDDDPDGDAMTAEVQSGVAGSNGGTFSIAENGEITFDPGTDFQWMDAGESIATTLTYVISDGNGESDTATITVIVNGAEDATATGPDTNTTPEDTAVSGNVLANDSDVDTNDDPLTVVSHSTPTNGSVTVATDGSYTYTPNPDFHGTDTFTYTTSTGATETVTITVTPVNDAPVAVENFYTVGEDATSSVIGNAITDGVVGSVDSDVDGDSLMAVAQSGVAGSNGGTFSIGTDGAVTFDPGTDFQNLDAGQSATTTLTYTISDGNGETDTATITVIVNGAEDATATAPDTHTTPEDTPVSGNVLANDSDADTSDNPLLVTSNTNPANGSVTVSANGNYTYTPDPNFNGTDSFTYTTNTGATETVTITVTPVNDAPEAEDNSYAAGEDDTSSVIGNAITDLEGTLVDSDLDGDSLTAVVQSGVAGSNGGTFSIASNGDITFDPGTDFQGLDAGESAATTLTYTITDTSGSTDTATITVTVNGAEDATVAAPDSNTTPENTAVNGNVLANDTDPDTSDNPLRVASHTNPANGSVTVAADGNYTYTPNANFNGTDTFTYTTDTGVSETVTITVTSVNDAPVAEDNSYTVDEDDTSAVIGNAITDLEGTLVDSDLDGDALTAVAQAGVAGSNGGTFSIATNGEVTFDPGTDFQGLGVSETAVTTFTYTISDPSGATDTATISVNVVGENDAPDAVNDVAQTNEDQPIFNFPILRNDSDPDGDTISLVGTPTAANGTITVNIDGTINYTPNPNFNGTDTVSYTITDPAGLTDTATVTITVNPVNDPPVAVNDTASTNEDTPIASIDVLGNDTDPDGDTLSVTSASSSNGTVTINPDGTLAYTPHSNFNGVDTITYTISDGNGGTSTATVEVTVTGVNDPPVADPAAGVVKEDEVSVVSGQLNASDEEGDALSYTAVTMAAADNGYGTVTIDANGAWSYNLDNANATVDALAPGETLIDTYTYTVSDGNGGMDTEVITITIQGTNDVPQIMNATPSVNEDGTGDAAQEPFLRLNETGGDDYALSSNIDDFPSTALTLEVTFTGSATATNQQFLFSYAVPGVDNEVLLASAPSGGLTLYLDGGVSASLGVPHASAFDGSEHTLSVTWDSATGELITYLDGVQASVNTHGIGAVLEQGGTIVLGQDQDSVGGGFDPAHYFSGDIAEVRLFDDVRTSAEIAANAGNLLPNPDTEAGLILNWQMTSLEGDDVVIDLAGDHDLNLEAGTRHLLEITGTLTATDVDNGDTVTFTPMTEVLANNGYGTFTLASDGTWSYLLNNAHPAVQALKDGETTLDVITVEAVDSHGGTQTREISITIHGANDRPAADPSAGLVQEEIQPLVSGQLIASDVEGDDLTYTAVTDVMGAQGYGEFTIDADGAWNYVLNSTHPDIDGLSPGDSTTDTYVYTVTDSNGATNVETITVTILGTNDLPTGITIDSSNIDENVMFDLMAGTGERAGVAVGTLTTLSLDIDDTYTYEIIEDDPTEFNWFEIGGPNGDQIVVKSNTDLNHEIREFHQVKVRVTDSGGETFVETLTIQVNDLNEAPQNFVISLEGEIDGNDETVNAASAISADPSPDLIALPDGGFVKIYTAMRENGAGEGRYIVAQRYDSSSQEVGGALQISTSEAPLGASANAIVLADGSYVVAYEISDGSGGTDIAFQRLDSTWTPVGSETLAPASVGGIQENVSLHALIGGGFAMSWDNTSTGGIETRVFDATGTPISVQMNLVGASNPSVAALAAGGFLVAHEASDGSGNGIFAQLYDAVGTAVGTAFAISETIAGEQSTPQAVTRVNGELGVVWVETRADGTSAIMFRNFDATGAPLGSERELTSDAAGDLVLDDITALQDGGYFISYTDVTDPATGQGDVFGWRISPVGDPVSQAADNSEAQGSHRDSSIVELTDGDIILAWESHKNDATGDDRAVDHIHRNFIGSGTAPGSIGRDPISTHVLSESGDYTSEVVGLADGSYIAFWRSLNVDGDGWALVGQRYDADGVKVGSSYTVNTSTAGDQGYPSAAQLEDGGFVIAFESDGEIIVQRYTGGGVELGGNVTVNTTTVGAQTQPAISAMADGGYVIAWHSEGQGIVTQQYTREGFVFGDETVVTATGVDSEVPLSVAGTANGEIVVTWASSSGDIMAQRYAGPGNPLGLPFTVNSSLAGEQTTPIVAALEGGGYVIVWASSGGEDGDGGSILAQRYSADGSVNGTEFVVNSSGANTQNHPEILGLNDGGFIIVWESDHRTDNQSEIWGQRYNADGSPREAEFQVSLDTVNGAVSERQGLPSAAQLVNGNIVFAWHSEDSRGDVEEGIKVRLFEQMASEDDTGPIIIATLGSDDIDEGDTHVYTINSIVGGPLREDTGLPAYTAAELADMFELRNGNEVWLKSGQSFRNLAQFVQEFQFNLTVVDQGGLSLTDDVIISINGGRDYPTNIMIDDGDTFGATDDDIEATVQDGATGGTVVGVLSISDVDIDDDHTYEIVEDDPDEYHIFEVINGNEIAVKAGFETAAQERATHFVTVRVTDSQGLEYEEVITVRVDRPNEAPTQINLAPEGEFVDQTEFAITAEHTADTFNVNATVIPLDAGGAENGDYWLVFSGMDSYHTTNWFAQRYDASGNTVGSRVDIAPGASHYGDAVRLDNGNIAVTYFTGGRVSFEIYDPSDFSTVVPRTQIPNGAISTEYAMSIGTIDNGRFVVQWSGHNSGGAVRDSYIAVYENDGTPVTTPTIVNQFTAGYQGWNNGDAIVATDDGGFFVIYRTEGFDGSSNGIAARRFDNNGVPLANEFVINDYTSGGQTYPDSIKLDNGNILVTWYGSHPLDNSSNGVIGKIIDQNGNEVVGEFLINTTTSSEQSYPDAFALSDGGFFVTWESSDDIRGQRFDASGNKVGSEILLESGPGQQTTTWVSSAEIADGNLVIVTRDDEGPGITHKIIDVNGNVVADPSDTFVDYFSGHFDHDSIVLDNGSIVTVNSNADIYIRTVAQDGTTIVSDVRLSDHNFDGQYFPRIDNLADGGYVAVWYSYDRQGEDTSGAGIRMARFDALGNEIGDQVIVNTSYATSQFYPDVAGLADGGWVVTWYTSDSSIDGSGTAILAQRFDTDGRPVGGEFLVNQFASGTQQRPEIAALEGGGFVITWENRGGDGSGGGISARVYDATGTPVSAEIQVNDLIANTQVNASLVGLAGGGFVIVWDDSDTADGDEQGVAARIFDASGVPLGNQFTVNSTTSGGQRFGDVTSLQDGGFVITWEDAAHRTDWIEIRAQRFDASGNPVGAERVVSQDPNGNAFFPKVVEGLDGEVVFTFQYHGESGGHEIRSVVWDTGVLETVAAGSVIANLSAVDANNEAGTESHTYQILSDPSGLFEISGSELRLQAGATLDYETATSHSIQIRVTDSGGATYDQTVSFDVLDVAAAPIVIDLDGDGAEFRNIKAGSIFDIDGDGEAEQTAWAGADDALLVYDKNDDGDITDTDEISFTGYVEGAETDLDGLRAFDTDEDWALTEEDAEWERFFLWNDADGDGDVDEGELQSLSAAGVESIALRSDEAAYEASEGDVFVHGEAEVRFTDGSTGVAADAAFDYVELALDESDDETLVVNQDNGAEQDLYRDEPTAHHPAEVADDLPDYGEGGHSPTIAIDEQARVDAQMS